MPDPGIATAADYSEALLVARRAKSGLALLLMLMLVGQLAVFFLVRYDVIHLSSLQTTVHETVHDTIKDIAPAAGPTTEPASGERWVDVAHYLTGVMILGGIACALVLMMTLCLIDHIMLVGRLIGVGKVTSALIWSLLLIVFLFPWQTFMSGAGLLHPEFRVPGVLWTWDELLARFDFNGQFTGGNWADATLSWFRFVGAPVVAIVVVLIVQMRSNRGLRMALGEDEIINEMMRAT